MKTLFSMFVGVVFVCACSRASESDPETVLTKFQVKPGKIDELLQLLDRAWATYQRLGLTFEKPHIVMRGRDENGEFVAEILPWKSHAAPDHAPAEVHAIWDEMQNICEKRAGHAAIEFPEVEVVRNNS